MTNVGRSDFDLEERTAKFGELAIDLAISLDKSPILSPLITQFIKAATSVGANYCEANDAESKPDFRHKISICRKEANETKYWCRMLSKACPSAKAQLREIWQEVNELHLIFSKIIRTTDKNLQQSLPSTR